MKSHLSATAPSVNSDDLCAFPIAVAAHNHDAFIVDAYVDTTRRNVTHEAAEFGDCKMPLGSAQCKLALLSRRLRQAYWKVLGILRLGHRKSYSLQASRPQRVTP